MREVGEGRWGKMSEKKKGLSRGGEEREKSERKQKRKIAHEDAVALRKREGPTHSSGDGAKREKSTKMSNDKIEARK
jgi:hypothetical protein